MLGIIKLLFQNRILAAIMLVIVVAAGIYQYRNLPTDAFPDISPVMVPIFAEGHGMAPEEVERFITYPIETAMNGLPGVTRIQSTSAFGMAVVYVYFEDDVDIYFARQIVSERLASAREKFPDTHSPPGLGPISTGLGEVFMYYLSPGEGFDSKGRDTLTYLRELNDWIVKIQLQTVPGITEVLSMGGYVLQYQVRINPFLLQKYSLTISDIVEAIQADNRNVGGQFLVLGSQEHLVRGIGLVEDLEQLRDIQIKVEQGIPVRIEDVAEVDYGREIRRGVVTRNGGEEVVAGIVMKLYGTNTSRVISRLQDKFPEIQAALPTGINLVPYYNQSRLVENANGTMRNALLQGGALVVIVLFLFLGNWRTALIVAVSLPFCAIIAFLGMGLTGLSANLMSLAGIAVAIGMLGDGAIVMVENIHRHFGLTRHKGENKITIIEEAVGDVYRPILFSVGIIIMVFLPLFTLESVEHKMFSPMALTIIFALVGSLGAALILAPLLSSLLLQSKHQKDPSLITWMRKIYRQFLQMAFKTRKFVILAAGVVFILCLFTIPYLGTEFMPVLEEGNVQVLVAFPPSTSLQKVTESVHKLEKMALEYPEITETITKIGRPEAGSHPHPVNFASIQMELAASEKWRFDGKEELIQSLNQTLGQFPGIQLNFTQPIQNMFDELLSGARTQLAMKLYGDDLEILKSTAEEISSLIETVPGLVDLGVEQNFGQPQVQIVPKRDVLARNGVKVDKLLETVEQAVGGEVVAPLYKGTRRFGIHVRFQEEFRQTPADISDILIRTPTGARIPLGQLADVTQVVGPVQVNREKNQRRWVISANVRGRDIGSVVEDIKERIQKNVKLPNGYFLEYGGQFQSQQRAMKRLSIIVPLVLAAIFLLLFMALHSFKQALLIYLNIPLALIGGVLGIFVMGEYLSVPASIGFIALFGISVQNGLVLVTYFNQLKNEGNGTRDAVLQGADLRLRPVLMTALTTVLGLLPLLLSTGAGSEVQRPLATVVVFGLSTSTLLTLFLLPLLYDWIYRGN